MKISNIHAREILDSRGNPTLEAEVTLENGIIGRSAVPSGASTGSHEAHELRDNDSARFGGKGVLKAVANVNTEIAKAIIGKDSKNQTEIDEALIALDSTLEKKRLGANAILGVSLVVANVSAQEEKKSLFAYLQNLSGNEQVSLPMPLCNVINGGQHAAGSTDIQEFMIVPVGANSFSHAVQMLSEIFHSLKKVLKEAGYTTTVGDEGGYAPAVKKGNSEALELLQTAVTSAGYKLGADIAFALDVAASELYKDGKYELACEGKTLTSDEMIAWYEDLCAKYPIVSIEDGLAEDDWEGWQKLTERLGNKVQLVGDDLLVTNTKFLERAITEKSCNSILVKVNQIGTLSETMQAVQMAKEANFSAIISHRSGETEDVTIAHIAVGLNTGQIKTGSVSRGERTAKYNELLRIEEALGASAVLANPFK
jgi:enolase